MIALDIFFMFFSSSIIGYAFSKPLTSKVNKILTILLYAIPLVIINYLSNFSTFIENLIPDYNLRMNIKMILVPTCWLIYFLALFKEPIKRKLFVFIVMAVCNAVSESIIALIISELLKVPSVEVREIEWSSKIIYYIFAVIGYGIFSYLGYLICTKKKFNISTPVIIHFSAIIMINILIILTSINSFAFTNDVFSQINLLVSPILILLLSFSLYGVMKKLSDREILQEKLYWVENVKSLELEYYDNLQQKSNEVRKIRHDFKDHIETINMLMNEDTNESIKMAKEILASLNDSISAIQIPVYTENVVVNAVVGAKIEEAYRNNININTAMDLPHEISVESIDLNCVFLNLLNNAIEACKKLPKTIKKEIILKATIQAGHLIIKTENPCLSIDTDKNGKIRTSKADKENHGLGLTLINDIAQKYNGTFETNTENNIFTAVVSLKVQEVG